jgi:hypothetical protein
MEADLAVLEHKLALLIARVEALREANASLERDLAQARARNRELSQRIEAASIRLDALLERLPEGSR